VAGTPGTAAGMPATGRGDWLEDRRPLALLLHPSSKAVSCPGRGAPTPELQSREISPTRVSSAPVLLRPRAPMQQASSPAVFIRGAYLSHLHLRLSFKATSSSTAVLLLHELVLIFLESGKRCMCMFFSGSSILTHFFSTLDVL
jgi:hypothetical protein